MRKSLICIYCHVCHHFLVKIAAFIFEKLLPNCCTFEKSSKNTVSDCFGETFVPTIFEKKLNFQNGQISCESRRNVLVILIFSTKPLDKHGITLVRMTYPPFRSLRKKHQEQWHGTLLILHILSNTEDVPC